VFLNGHEESQGYLCSVHVTQHGFCSSCGRYVADKDEHRTTWALYGRCRACWSALLGEV
jgi:hypothetical protein